MSDHPSKGFARRKFLQGIGLAVGAGALAPILAACGGAPAPTAAPTAKPAAEATKPAAQPAAQATKPAAEPTKPAAQPAAPAASRSASGLSWVASPINGGKAVELEAWDWHQPRIDVWKAWFEEYGSVQKNVKINITQVPQAEYLKKLQTGIPSGTAPDMLYFHNNWHSQLVDTELVDPLPEDRFPRNALNANFLGMKEGYTQDVKTKQPRYMITGVMHGGIYYNKDLWEKAGFKEADLPKTWDDLIVKAKALTERDSAGRINVAGYAFNGDIGSTINYLRYQLGEFQYSADGKKVRYDTPGMRQAMKFFLDAYDVHKVNSREFLPSREAFQNGKAAMLFAWSWVTGWLNTNAKNINWGIAPCPTWTGKNEPAVGANNFDPLSFVVPSTTKPEKKEAAWDYIHWMFGTDDRIIQHTLIPPSPPAVKGLADHELIQKDPTLKALMPQTEYTIYAMGGPPLLTPLFTKYFEDGIFKAGMSIDDACKRAQAEADQIMAQGEWPAAARERAYIHANLMKQD